MDCCNKDSHDKSSNHQNKSPKSKWLWVCVLALMAFLLAFFVFKISIGNIFFYAALLLCPLMHFLMMKGMGHGDKK